MRHVIEMPDPDGNPIKEQRVNTCPAEVSKTKADSLSGQGPIGFVNRIGELVPSKSRETSLLCGVGRGKERLPLTRLSAF